MIRVPPIPVQVHESKRHGCHADCQKVSCCCLKTNLRNPLHADNVAYKWGIHPELETQDSRHQKSNIGISVAWRKRIGKIIWHQIKKYRQINLPDPFWLPALFLPCSYKGSLNPIENWGANYKTSEKMNTKISIWTADFLSQLLHEVGNILIFAPKQILFL